MNTANTFICEMKAINIYRLNKAIKHKIDPKKTVARDDVTWGGMACKILNKINGLARESN